MATTTEAPTVSHRFVEAVRERIATMVVEQDIMVERLLMALFTNLLLADEINRAAPKIQSALLEAKQERRVTIGNHTFTLPAPFIVVATQNPIEQSGTFELPKTQLNRFMLCH